ncbi:hypothetical protein RND71_040236 [Anisodus tanguticus]|uniref:DUF4283 domain-containing protein n=1 Tax=Anisodus tanguticus TaxID=243964 RepID=A0AAE1QRS8_9SOLA|nr:hypothetical protein RND71_040236 [Anisodus tanguticus]
MAIAASGRPPSEVVQPPTTSPTIPTPLDYSKLFKPSVLNHHVFAAGGQNPSSGGGNTTPSQVPFKPITYLHGEPTIRFNKEEIELMINQQDLRFAVVGKFSYGWPEISSLRTSIPKQCELKGEVRIGLLCNRHVLIRCSLFEDYLTLMSKPNWNIQEKGTIFSMRTFKWSTWFDSEEETSLVVTWISLPGLPPTYFGEAQLFSIAAAGRPLAIDVATKNKTRPSCARLQGHELRGCWKLHPELMPEKEQGIEKGKEAAAKPESHTGNAIIPATEATTAPPLSSGNQRKTADLPPETLAGITANPTHIDNPTRPGNPTHLITYPAPSDPTIGNPTEEEEMEVEEKELGEDASVDQPGQIVVREKELSPIAIEAFFERVRTISAKKKKMFEWRCAREKEKARERNPYRIPGELARPRRSPATSL